MGSVDAIHAGLDAILAEIAAGKFQWDVKLEDVHMNIEQALTKRVPAAAKLHTARSRNDQIATDMRLWFKHAAGVLAALAWGLDYVAGLMGAKKAGASKMALMGAAAGTVLGLFMGLVGVLFMPLVGAAVGEYLAQKDQIRAVKVGVATWVGIMVGLIAKVVLAFIMVGIFGAALLI